MGTKDKLTARFISLPKDFTFDELRSLLKVLGFVEDNKGKTSGSRVCFVKDGYVPIRLHKPHPGNIVKRYAMRQVFDLLVSAGLIEI